MFLSIANRTNRSVSRHARLAAAGAAIVFLATFAACGESEGNFSAGPGPTDTDFEGEWTGVYTDSRESGAIDWDVDQTGTQVSGTATVTRTANVPRPASVQGTTMGTAITFTITLLPPCEGTMSGTATIRADQVVQTATNFNGTYTGSDCQGTFSDGTITMCRGQGCPF